ncbi:MAG: hypothetical protein HZB83_04965 [Deltaproteobacteria bacterium]|nr:hypothetical protein [Deltaproteobacteria bacterium]
MNGKKTLFTVLIAASFMLAAFVVKANAMPHVQFPLSEDIKAGKESLKEIETLYAKVEEALMKKDVDGIMNFYANDYFHRGITKQQLRGLWSDIFAKFDKLNSIHIFTDISVRDNEAAIVCTGTLFGVPKGSKDGKHVSVDRWTNQSHYLSRTGGSWQIVGGASHWMTETKVNPGGAVEYQLEFHPLF